MESAAQYLLALALAALAAWLIPAIANGAIERGPSAFALLVRGWRADPWPRGVQEEDRDRPWAWRLSRSASSSAVQIDDGVAPVPARPLRGRTRSR